MKSDVNKRKEKNMEYEIEDVKNIIREKIEQNKSTLDEITVYIQETSNKNLSTIDRAYIERKYIRYCSKLWLQEVTNFLVEVTKDNVKQRDVAREIISKISTIQSINQIPTNLSKLQYYDLLLKHRQLIDRETEEIIINNFKEQCYGQLIGCNNTARKELTFLEALKDFLNSFETLETITKKLFLPEFYTGNISFHKLLQTIINLEAKNYGEKFVALQNAAKILNDEEHFLLIGVIKEICEGYVVPVEILEKELDNRPIIEVKGRIININEILVQLESKLQNSKNGINEVHFVGTDSIHIRVNLQKDIWHGKNIVIYTNVIKVHDVVTWDVSGADASFTYSDNAGVDTNGHGKHGADGYAGESGGNVTIVTKSITNPEEWTIISNGGSGGKGQDGGNGKNGFTGKGVQTSTFYSDFPSMVSFACPRGTRQTRVKETVDSIKRLGSIEKNWSDGNDYFVKVVTSEGNEITFSYCSGSFTTRYQAFLLYSGSVGRPGGDGGKCGLGGQGGFPGEINMNNKYIKVTSRSGQNGDKGKGGLFGEHGKNGWDMAYVDYQTWRDTIFYGTDMRSKLSLDYYTQDNAACTRIWCPYYDKYAGITARPNTHNTERMYEERQNISDNRALQKQALAVRKNAIISTNFVVYSEYCSRLDNILQGLKCNLEQTECDVLQSMRETKKESLKQEINTEVNTRRFANSTCLNEGKESSIPSRPKVTKTFKKADKEKKDTSLMETLKSSKSFKDWIAIKSTPLSYSDLEQLFVIFDKIKKGPKSKGLSKNEIESIEEILIRKYKLAVLQIIATKLSPYQSSSEIKDQKSLPVNMEKYLIVSKKADKKLYHVILGTLNQYIFDDSKEQRQKICKFLKENLDDETNETLKHCIQIFILESKDMKNISPDVEKFRNEYIDHFQKKSRNVTLLMKSLTKEVQRHNGLYDLWIESVTDKSKEQILVERMKKDKFLFTLYCRFQDQLKEEYDWSICYANKSILKEYKKYIEESGLISASYKELLACLFNVSIKIYGRTKDNQFSLMYDYNKSSERSIYILQNKKEYIQLEIDEDYLRLDKERKWKDNCYARVLNDVELLTQKKKLDEYLKSQTFLSSPIVKSEQLEWSLYDKDDPKEEDVYIDEILNYFPNETDERLEMKQRLEKLKYKITGQGGLLYLIAQSFLNEGRHISTQVLYYLINSILKDVIENDEDTISFHWMITSRSQRYWIIELTLLELQNYFKKPLTTEQLKWRERLSNINEDILVLLKVKLDREASVSVQCIDEILYLLHSIPNEVEILSDLGLSEWPYFLKEEYWVSKLLKLASWEEKDELLAASYYVLSVENSFGTVVVEKLLEIMEAKKQNFTSKNLIYILHNFHNETWQLNENALSSFSVNNLADWMKTMEDKVKLTDCFEERSILELIPLIEENSNTSPSIRKILPNIKKCILDKSPSIGHDVFNGKTVYEFTESDIKKWVNHLNDLEKKDNLLNNIKLYIGGRYAEVLAVIDRAIELKKGFKLRDTQKLSILTLLMNETNTLEQVSTGEGKSLIVVAVSIVKALCGEKVDIITSSSVLAKRDSEENKNIYQLFNISVSHNCDEIIEQRKAAYSNNQIVYGDLSSFQRDYLLDRFYKRNILGNRTFDNIIVDEVDSMLLDKGNNMLYLSHDLTGLDELESVYTYIWQFVNRPCESFEDFRRSFDPKFIENAILYDLHGLIEEKDIKEIDANLSKEEIATLWGCLVDANIVDNRGRLLSKESVSVERVGEILPDKFSCYIAGFHYLINETVNRDKLIDVPNYLKIFIEEHLEAWINSARMALLMKERYDYIVDVDRSGTSCDRNPQIIILDRDTGTDQVNSQWDEALHQFLQLKHGCKLSLQSLKAVFVSNVSYLKLYTCLYGLSGTLGLHGERSLLEDIYKVDFCIVPTAKAKQFYEMKPIICNNKKEWMDEICKTTNKLTTEKSRSVLIICEAVKDVQELYASFGGKAATNVHTYVRDYEEFSIAKGDKEVGEKQIIIATNLAGRGTDIKITKELNEAGGLHICLPYLPNNARIEQQANGRAARSGNKGSGQLIIINPEEKQIFRLKKQRDVEELCRISRIKDHYEKQTLIEENYFNKFKEQYEKLDKHLDKSEVSDELKNILLQSCLDEWAFWLDRNSKRIKNSAEENKIKVLDVSIDRFVEELQSKCEKGDDWSAWVKDQPCHMLKLGVYFAEAKSYDKAIDIFDEIIKREPDFSTAAQYYKAFAIGKKINWEKRDKHKREVEKFEELLRNVAKRLDLRRQKRMCAASVFDKISDFNNEGIIKIDAYAAQQKSLNEVSSEFTKSIDDIFGHAVVSEHFVGHNVKEPLAITLYEDMMQMGILEWPKVSKNIPKVALNKISNDFSLPLEKLSAYLGTYEGKNIDERLFIKDLKKNLVIPCRETFWKLLISKGILTNEFNYVLLNKEKLKDCDPSLLNVLLKEEKNNKNEDSLINKDLKQVFLYGERVNANKDSLLFEKDNIRTTIGKDKYHTLKKFGTFTFNKLACIDTEKLKSIIFPQYDSITINDFNTINIAKEEAEKILAELVDKEILGSDDNNKGTYRLIAPYTKIEQLELSFRPVYESNVKILLSMCFTYRIALQRMMENSEDSSQLLRLQLIAEPYKNLFFSLTDEGIVTPAKVTTKYKDVESKLKNKYYEKMPQNNIMSLLKQNKFIPLQFFDEALWNDLIQKEWILVHSLFKDGSLSVTKVYSINDSRKARKPLDSIYRDIEETLHVVMDDLARLLKDETISNIVSTLEQLRSSLNTLDCPDPCLKPLHEIDVKDFGNVEEIRLFILNGFDRLLVLKEKKYTMKMLLYTAGVIIIGLCQIAVGVIIELYSAGVMTHVGAAFMNEGISDLMFATSALTSGYFSWKDYRQHKIQSLITTVATAGIGAFLSRGAKFSYFGNKVGGTSLGLGQKNISKMAGKELFDFVAKSSTNIVTVSLTREVCKRIAIKTFEGIAFGITNAAIDMLIQKQLHSFCDSLTFTVLSDIEKKVTNHPITSTLRESYRVLGKEGARKMVNDISKVMSKDKEYAEKLFSVAGQVFTTLSQGIMQAANKMSQAKQNSGIVTIPMNIIGKIFTMIQITAHVAKIILLTDDYLNKMNDKMQQQLSYQRSSVVKEATEVTEEEYKEFERETTDRWKSILRGQAQQIIAQHIVGPLLKGLARKLLGKIGTFIKAVYRNCKETRYFKQFQEKQREYQNKLSEIEKQTDGGDKTEIKAQIRKEYDNSLIRLMAKTRNPILFAAIIDEGVPMETVCLKSCVNVIPNALKKKGINVEPFTVNVKEKNGAQQRFSSNENTNGRCINLELNDNHFTLCESDSSNNNSDTMASNDSANDDSRNNCLFEALKRAIPELNNLTAEQFRKCITDYIRTDPEIKHFLSQGWHRLPLAFNLYGGDRRETKRITSKELKKKMKDKTFKFSQSSVATHTQEDRLHIGELSENIKKDKWQGKPVRVLETSEGNYVTMDHRRVLAVAVSDDPNVEMEMAVYGPEDEFSTENNNDLEGEGNTGVNKNYETTAGGLVKKRMMRSNSLEYSDTTQGFDVNQLRIRLVKSNYVNARKTEQRLADLGCDMGPKRYKKGNDKPPRSKSSNR